MWGEHDVCALPSARLLLFLRKNKFIGDICIDLTHVLQPSLEQLIHQIKRNPALPYPT
jgi:hypothetical protein